MKEEYRYIGDPAIRAIEECGELIQAITKAERFGYGCYHPDDPTKETNFKAIMREWRDLDRVMNEFMMKRRI